MTVCDVEEADIKRVELPQVVSGIPTQMSLMLSHIESSAGYCNISSYLFLFCFALYEGIGDRFLLLLRITDLIQNAFIL